MSLCLSVYVFLYRSGDVLTMFLRRPSKRKTRDMQATTRDIRSFALTTDHLFIFDALM